MNDAQKRMKRYVNAIERRLHLPRDVKARVMSDFGSSIQARRERGMSDEEIYEELGSPKKAAQELNEQMKAFAYRKSPWRFLFLGLAILSGGWLVLYQLLLRFGMLLDTLKISFFPSESASVGIIGGADGPTAIFVTGTTAMGQGFDWDVPIMVLLLAVGLLGYVLLRRCRHK